MEINENKDKMRINLTSKISKFKVLYLNFYFWKTFICCLYQKITYVDCFQVKIVVLLQI